MKNTKNGLASALVSGLRLEAVDMLGLAMIQVAIYLIVFAVVGIAVPTGSPEPADFGWPGLAALIMGVLLVFVEANSQFGTTFTLAVRLGRPRRTALAGSFVTCLVFGALTLLLTAALDAIWAIAFGFQGQSVLAMVPLWGCAAMVYLPIAVTVLEQAVAWVFGPKSMLFFLLIFLLVCQLPAQLVEDGPWAAYGSAVLAVLPLVLPAIGLLITAIGLRVLLRVDLKL